MTIHHLNSLQLGNLTSVQGDLHIHDSRLEFKINQLRSTTGTGVISLRNVQLFNSSSFLNLEQTSGSVILVGISGLDKLDEMFPKLQKVQGSFILQSDVKLSDYSSDLKNVRGAFNVSALDAGNSSWTCQRIRQVYNSDIVQGSFYCSFPGDIISENGSNIIRVLIWEYLSLLLFLNFLN